MLFWSCLDWPGLLGRIRELGVIDIYAVSELFRQFVQRTLEIGFVHRILLRITTYEHVGPETIVL
jgi:hypothetical protein